ncbi:MAG: hypothetical protein ACTSXJ_04665 [Candidatus Baldrarchaeia archaeon]
MSEIRCWRCGKKFKPSEKNKRNAYGMTYYQCPYCKALTPGK